MMNKQIAFGELFEQQSSWFSLDKASRLAISNIGHDFELEEKCVAHLVGAQVASAPNAISLVWGDEKITYAELDARSTRLAHHLRGLGVGPDVVVGLLLERSPSFVVGALAIWKAGGAYLPLDAASPRERITTILNDAQAPIVVTRTELSRALAGGARKFVDMNCESTLAPSASNGPLACKSKPDDLAYVIYTSGSTGSPKGVEITHRSLLNLIAWHRRNFGVTSTDRATQVSNAGFDATVWEIWPYLAAGASVHIADETTRIAPEALRDWILKEKITVSFVPTPLAEYLITLDWPADASLRFLLTGADSLQHYPRPGLPFVLVNNYGPTECTVVATSGRVLPKGHPNRPPAIGRAIENTKILILDDLMREVPNGTPGQIHIGGIGLARGYRNSLELTEAKFIPDPFSDDPDARLFKTGDMAYFRPDGQLEFLGRIDDQIKIRGNRIELNEIVVALSRHRMIHANVVVTRRSASGDKRLVAYVVPKDGAKIYASDLRNHLRAQLPDYMLPEIFVLLSSLPLNPNGKVDRGALPPPNAMNTLRDASAVEPRTPIEKRLAGILAALLGVEQIGADDNFFLLGGHSLLGTQLIARVRDAFGVELPLRTLFDSPTVSELSAQIEQLLVVRLESMSEDEALRILNAQSDAAAEAI
jgi:amino acid adenylation domain-containing protein